MVRQCYVGYFHLVGVKSSSDAHAADDILVVLFGVIEEEDLRSDGVDGVDDEVERLLSYVDDVLVFEVNVQRVDFYLWVDVEETLSHHFDFRFIYGAVEGEELSVFVCDVDGVVVDDC